MPRQSREELLAKKAAYQRNYRVKHPEKSRTAVALSHSKYGKQYRARRREKYKQNQEEREASAKRAIEWNKVNVQRRRAINAKYGALHRDELNAKGKVWKSNNRDKCKTHKHARRAREKNCEGSHTAAEWRAILKRYEHRCSWCGVKETKTARLTRDHYIPLSKGGTNNASNIVPACFPCNSKKNRRDPIEFAQSLGLLL